MKNVIRKQAWNKKDFHKTLEDIELSKYYFLTLDDANSHGIPVCFTIVNGVHYAYLNNELKFIKIDKLQNILNDKDKIGNMKTINIMDWDNKFRLIIGNENVVKLNPVFFKNILSFDISNLNFDQFIINAEFIGFFVVIIDKQRIYPIYILNQNYIRFNHSIINIQQLFAFLDIQRLRHDNFIYKEEDWKSNDIDLFIDYNFSLQHVHNDKEGKNKKRMNTQTQKNKNNKNEKKKKESIAVSEEVKDIVDEAMQNLKNSNEKNDQKNKNTTEENEKENKKHENSDDEEELNKKMKSLKNDLGDKNESGEKEEKGNKEDDDDDESDMDSSEEAMRLLEILEERHGVVYEKEEDDKSDDDGKSDILITNGAFNLQNPKLQQVQPPIQDVQAKHKHKKKSNGNNKEWSVVEGRLPVPTLALAKSIEEYEDSVFQISNYTNEYSNRSYAVDHASGTRYYKGEANFDAVDAVTNLASKSKIKEENYVKFIFYSDEFNFWNATSYFATKIKQMSTDIGDPWNSLDKRAYVKHDFRMSSNTQAQKKLDEKYNKDIFNYNRKYGKNSLQNQNQRHNNNNINNNNHVWNGINNSIRNQQPQPPTQKKVEDMSFIDKMDDNSGAI